MAQGDADRIPPGFPGRELIVMGLDDLRAGRETVEALLVATGAPRLRVAGLRVPGPDVLDSGERMYRLLEKRDPDSAYSNYNALRRRLVSFCVALEHDVGARERVARSGDS